METMSKPAIVYVDTDAKSLEQVTSELHKRYSADYEVYCRSSVEEALETLQAWRESQRKVAVLLSACDLGSTSGSQFLDEAHALYPEARRGLLVDWSQPASSAQVLQAMAENQIDSFGPRPLSSPDEAFHKFVTDFLEEWASKHQPRFEFVQLIGEHWSPRSHELRDLLERNSIPHGFYDIRSQQAQTMLAEKGTSAEKLPVAILFNGQVLVQPDNRELANAVDVSTLYELEADMDDQRPFDLLIVGAGPAGLSAGVYASSEGLKTLLIERQAIGGQAGMSAEIRNYLGFPTGIAGDELAERAYRQAWLFGAEFRITHEVTGLRVEGNKRCITVDGGEEILTDAVILATGVDYRKLDLPELDRLYGRGVFYGATYTESNALRGKPVVIVGGGNSSGQAALHLSRYASSVTLLTREDSLDEFMSEYLIRELESCSGVSIRPCCEIVHAAGEDRLESITLEDRTSGKRETLPAAGLFVMIGADPHTDWLPDEIARDPEGYIVTGEDLHNAQLMQAIEHPGWTLQRNPYLFETSIPGVFAIGDVRHRSVKRVASAVGEGAIAVSQVHQYLAELENKD